MWHDFKVSWIFPVKKSGTNFAYFDPLYEIKTKYLWVKKDVGYFHNHLWILDLWISGYILKSFINDRTYILELKIKYINSKITKKYKWKNRFVCIDFVVKKGKIYLEDSGDL